MNASVWSEAMHGHIAAALIEHAPAGAQTEPHLRALIEEAVARPGKLFRARLVMATTEAHGIEREVGLALATAVEYYHLASLLLDDLPCMDDATTRRGALCAHRVYGESTAILAALAFINRAYGLVGMSLAGQRREVWLPVQACLDACLGTAGLLGGQARDLRFATGDRTSREVGRVALGKTGAMLWLGLLMPALIARPSRAEVRELEALCVYWGLAFQGLDDVRDVLATSVDAGKTTRRDQALTRPNLAVALGLPQACTRIRRLLAQAERAIRRLRALDPAWAYLDEFQRYFASSAAPLADAETEIAA